MHTPTDRETGAFLLVLAIRIMLALAVGTLVGAVVRWLGGPAEMTGALVVGSWIACVAIFPITFVIPWYTTRSLPRGLLRYRWLLARAVREHGRGQRRSITTWPPGSDAWGLYLTLLAGMAAGARGRTRDHERLLEAARRVVDTGGDQAVDQAFSQGRARLDAYGRIFAELAALDRTAEAEPYAWAAVAEFGAPAGRQLYHPATRTAVRALWRARWTAGEHTPELAQRLLMVTEDDEWREEFLREAVAAGFPFRLPLVRMPSVGPTEREEIARAGLTTEPELLGELVRWLGADNRLDEAINLARDEEQRENPFASSQLERAGWWRHHGQDPGVRQSVTHTNTSPSWSGGSYSHLMNWSGTGTSGVGSVPGAGI